MSANSNRTAGGPTVADLGERALIERVRARAGHPPAWTALGIGDDAAVLAPARGQLDVVTTDSLVEDIHFRRAWSDARSIGRKAVAINLSDLAAMGASARAILLSLAVPPALPVEDFDALVDGVVTETIAAGAGLVGGNIAQSPGPLVVNITAIGVVGRRRMLTRGGGRAGAELYVTGVVGAASAGLAILRSGARRTEQDPGMAECVRHFESPAPRLRCGRVVAGHRAATACIDLSDGLADGARQIAQASLTGVVLEANAIPVHAGASDWFARHGADPVTAALAGGEDYELLFAVPPRRRRAFLGAMSRCSPLTATRVGRLTAESGAWLSRSGEMEPLPAGFTHFGAKIEPGTD